MYRLFLLFLLMSVGGIVFSQSITIKGIEPDVMDLSAKVGNKVHIQDGTYWAVLKFRTMETGFQIDVGPVLPKVVYEIGEVWIYVQPKTRFITIAHPKFGKSPTFHINPPTQASTVYQLDVEMIAADGKSANVIYNKFCSVLVEPKKDVYVYINNEPIEVTDGEVQKKLEYGRYTLRVEGNMYYPYEQQIVVDDNLQPIKVALKPQFGWLNVETTPENGATVLIDNKQQNTKTPFKSDRIKSGDYTVSVLKDMYITSTRQITINDGETTNLSIEMPINYANVVISTVDGGDIYLNEKKVGLSKWSGRLSDGIYTVECRKDKHITKTETIKVVKGVAQTVKLDLVPIVGSLDIICVPTGSKITINGKDYGTTPQAINSLLVGSYEVVLSKDGFGTERRTITIEDGKTAEINTKLSTGKNITITSTPSGSSLYIDGKSFGITPQQLSLNYGEHTFKIIDNKGKIAEQKYTISEAGPNSYQLKTELDEIFTVKGVTFKMIAIEGGTFQMGDTFGGGYDNEKPVHSVTLSDYWIGETEVTQALWQAVMGSNPSGFKGSSKPVENISWNETQEFIRKLNTATGKQFRLPTESEWEYAARGGNKSKGYKYSGSNNIETVAWYPSNSNNITHDVKTKSPNELGIYDMTGNVYEWCKDLYSYYDSNAKTNPQGGTTSALTHILRGGSWYNNELYSRVSNRSYLKPEGKSSDLGLRLALVQDINTIVNSTSSLGKNIMITSIPSGSTLYVDGKNVGVTPQQLNLNYGEHTFKITDIKGKSTEQKYVISEIGPSGYQLKTLASNETFTVGGVNFTMIAVEGGTFQMGEEDIAMPVHNVTLSDYYIGETEVTQALWQAVMSSNPSNFKGNDRPVDNVSWSDCQEFIKRLNIATGNKFRLPTEAEWEYAARGGNKSKHYKYSGSNTIENVAWYRNNSNSTLNVKTKASNELGIYDMTGNVLEWCEDLYGDYSSNAETNPKGAMSGSYRILRGGGWGYSEPNCRIPYRGYYGQNSRNYCFGLRIALVK